MLCSLAGVLSILVYYVSILVLNTGPFADIFQPQFKYLVFRLLGLGKVWIVIIVTPLVALLPDFILSTWRAKYHRTPVDILLTRQDSLRKDSSQRYLM